MREGGFRNYHETNDVRGVVSDSFALHERVNKYLDEIPFPAVYGK
jgi:hypothetical protein